MNTYQITSIIMAVLVLIIILSVGLLFKSLLKEQGGGQNPDTPYSFSKFQLFLWTLVICPAFVLYWGFHDDHKPLLNETALVLLGIAGGVTMTAGIVSNVKETNNKTQKNPQLQTSLKMNLASSGFWSDILKDANGDFSLPRLQNLVFTFIFVIIFVIEFFNKGLADYPVFDKTAYVLMGITSGTYLIGKGLDK